jgi:hypothetical protein
MTTPDLRAVAEFLGFDLSGSWREKLTIPHVESCWN